MFHELERNGGFLSIEGTAQPSANSSLAEAFAPKAGLVLCGWQPSRFPVRPKRVARAALRRLALLLPTPAIPEQYHRPLGDWLANLRLRSKRCIMF
jgi:hypothetical protein